MGKPDDLETLRTQAPKFYFDAVRQVGHAARGIPALERHLWGNVEAEYHYQRKYFPSAFPAEDELGMTTQPQPAKKKRKRKPRLDEYDSDLERDYAKYLAGELSEGRINRIVHHPFRIVIEGSTYEPDFLVFHYFEIAQIHEVKAYWKPHNRKAFCQARHKWEWLWPFKVVTREDGKFVVHDDWVNPPKGKKE